MKFNELLKLQANEFRKKGIPGLKDLISSYINLISEPEVMTTGPFMLQVEPTTFCNLECKMCINPLRTERRMHMSFKDFRKIVDSIPSLAKLSLVGAGEPLLNPDLFKMVTYAKSKDILVGFATNGSLLNEANCGKIADSRLDWINISVDSANKNHYEGIRKGASFDQLCENIKRLINLKKRGSLPEVSLWSVIMGDNLKVLAQLIDLAAELGIKNVFMQFQHDWGSSEMKKNISGSIPISFLKDLKESIRQVRFRARKKGINFRHVNVPGFSLKRGCKWPWKSAYVTVDGFLTPCCMRGYNPEIINFGSIFNEPFAKIWNNDLYRSFRAKLKSDIPPEYCLGCTSYYK